MVRSRNTHAFIIAGPLPSGTSYTKHCRYTDSLHSHQWNLQPMAVPELKGQAKQQGSQSKKGPNNLLIQSTNNYFCVAAPTMCQVLWRRYIKQSSPAPLYYCLEKDCGVPQNQLSLDLILGAIWSHQSFWVGKWHRLIPILSEPSGRWRK